MAKKQIIRITESDLKRVIKESVNKILKEDFQSKFEYYTDILDAYYNKMKDGVMLSNDQMKQIEEIYDFLTDTYAYDDDTHYQYINMARELLNFD
jgi:hypothetical protein